MLSGITFNFAISALVSILILIVFLMIKEFTSNRYTKRREFMNLNYLVSIPINAFVVIFVLTTVYKTFLAML